MGNEAEELVELIERLKSSGIVVVVEGMKDRAALEKFGIINVIGLSKRPVFEIVENVAELGEACAILTDLDRKGKELYGKISRDLQTLGVRIDNSLREFLFRKTKLRQIEGLDTYFRGLH